MELITETVFLKSKEKVQEKLILYLAFRISTELVWFISRFTASINLFYKNHNVCVKKTLVAASDLYWSSVLIQITTVTLDPKLCIINVLHEEVFGAIHC